MRGVRTCSRCLLLLLHHRNTHSEHARTQMEAQSPNCGRRRCVFVHGVRISSRCLCIDTRALLCYSNQLHHAALHKRAHRLRRSRAAAVSRLQADTAGRGASPAWRPHGGRCSDSACVVDCLHHSKVRCTHRWRHACTDMRSCRHQKCVVISVPCVARCASASAGGIGGNL